MSSPDGLTSEGTIPIKVHFTGGLEIVFSNVRSLTVNLPLPPVGSGSNTSAETFSTTSSPISTSASSTSSTSSATISHLIQHLTTIPELDQNRKDLFALPSDNNQMVRPGILVLVNDADWALEGEGECVLSAGDEVVFVSTLHGG